MLSKLSQRFGTNCKKLFNNSVQLNSRCNYATAQATNNITYPRQGLDKTLPNASLTKLCDLGSYRKVLILGYGSIGEGILPLVLRHFNMPFENITVLTAQDRSKEAFAAKERFGVNVEVCEITQSNCSNVLNKYLTKKDVNNSDIMINVSVDVSSLDVMSYCNKNNILYVDTVIEPWKGDYFNKDLPIAQRSNYQFRESLLGLRSELERSNKENNKNNTTMVSCHGANPGMVSHFVKQALINIGNDLDYFIDNDMPNNVNDQLNWARLSQNLGIKTIHIAEFDSQVSNIYKKKNEFVNTWSIDGFISEGYGQPAELGWGTHEKELPFDAMTHNFGRGSAIYLKQPGLTTQVRTWTPKHENFLGYLVTHNEAVTISDYLTFRNENNNNSNNNNNVLYRPTVHYSYRPCNDAMLSIQEFVGQNYIEQASKRLMSDDIVSGIDELGVLLCGHKKNAYWFGSQLDVNYARSIVENNQATSLQVTATALAGILYAIKNPNLGILECEEIDHKFVLDIIEPYVAPLYGEYTDWTPLDANRSELWDEDGIDASDPWQFSNIRVMDFNTKQRSQLKMN